MFCKGTGMYETLHCIALRTVKYNDKSSILSVYTLETGRMALSIPAGKGPAAARIRALTMPMSCFECVAFIKPGREVHNFRDLKADESSLRADFQNPLRISLAFFLADFLNSLLKEPMADAKLWCLLQDTCRRLATEKGTRLPNFHIFTLLRLVRIMGIEPDRSTFSQGSILDLIDGVWRSGVPLDHNHWLDPYDSSVASWLTLMHERNYHLYRFSREQRNRIIDVMTDYFGFHGYVIKDLQSLAILKELF